MAFIGARTAESARLWHGKHIYRRGAEAQRENKEEFFLRVSASLRLGGKNCSLTFCGLGNSRSVWPLGHLLIARTRPPALRLATARRVWFYPRVQRIIVITGTDTGVGKTVLTAWLAAHLRAQGARVAALKPICSGGREDARALHHALGGALTLDEINPWHFRAPLAPLLAARQERRRVQFAEVITHIRSIARRFDTVLVEGAGGLLSPLGENFSTRDWITALRAEVIIVGRNQLGVANHLRLTLEALPPRAAAGAKIVLMSPSRPTAASRTNPALAREFFPNQPVVVLPWCGADAAVAVRMERVQAGVQALACSGTPRTRSAS